MRAVVLVLVGVFGCHEATPHATDAAGDSSFDADGDASPLACVPFDVAVTPVATVELLVWTGSEYLLPVQASPVVVQRITSDGTLESPLTLTDGAIFDLERDITWSGHELAVLSGTSRVGGDLTLTRYTADGTMVGETAVATGLAMGFVDHRIVRWMGDRYLVAWGNPDPNVNTHSFTLEEVSADGVASAPQVFTGHGNTPDMLASNSTTYLIESYTDSAPGSTFVTIDRASGTVSYTPTSIEFYSYTLLARDHDFVAYSIFFGDANVRGDALEVIDTNGHVTAELPTPTFDVPDFIAIPAGFHLAAPRSDQTGTYYVQDVDIAFDGTQLGPVNTRATIQMPGSSTGVYLAARGNGFATTWATGPHLALTAHVVQDCFP